MSDKKTSPAPLPTIRRIPVYLRILQDYKRNGIKWASATDIALELELKPIQVRKDMAFTSITGKPNKGYNVQQLIIAIKEFLGWDNIINAVLVGSGALGSAILGFEGVQEHGLNIMSAFDNDQSKIGTEIHDIEILPLTMLDEIISRQNIKVGIITVPAFSAQKIAELLIEAGIKGIWNFSPVKLKTPEHVIVQREDLSCGLAVLSAKLSAMDD
jgi:redox-sensing transcriptional repressor